MQCLDLLVEFKAECVVVDRDFYLFSDVKSRPNEVLHHTTPTATLWLSHLTTHTHHPTAATSNHSKRIHEYPKLDFVF